MKYVIKRKIPKYETAGEVTNGVTGEVGSYMLGNMSGIQGLGIEPLVSSTMLTMPKGMMSPDALRRAYQIPEYQGVGNISNFKGSLELITNQQQQQQQSANSGNETEKVDETNIFDFASLPYYGGDDLGSRATQMGMGLGRMATKGYGELSGSAKTANTVGTIFSGVGLGAGLLRNIASGAASVQGNIENQRLAQQREAEQRKKSQMQYSKGGGVYLGPGNNFDVSDITGEYMYPLPKSMEGQANVEVEKGEYVEQPGQAPAEALGQTHEKGGTPVAVEAGTKVITDDTTIEPDFAKYIRDTYKIKATPKDTYATLMDRYKVKIGLKSAYGDQEKVLSKIKKNDKITDANTKRLNDSVLSKSVNDTNEVINGLEGRFTDFANIVYKEQEDRKRKYDEDTYFAKGGEVERKLMESAKEYGLSDDDIADIKRRLLDEVAGIRQKMVGGGTTLFGRPLKFRPVQNKFNNDSNEFGYQRLSGNGVYGGVNDEWLQELTRLVPTIGAYNSLDEVDPMELSRNIETGYSKLAGSWGSLATMENPIVSNAEDLRKYATTVNFGGEDNPANYPGRKDVAYHSRGKEGKLGEFHLSRPTIGLDVATMEQVRALNDAGITHFSQLFSEDKSEEAAKILGDDFSKMVALRFMPDMKDLDFVIDAYNPELQASGIDVKSPDIDLSPIPYDTGKGTGSDGTTGNANAGKGDNGKKGSSDFSYNGSALDFPEVFRMTPSPVTTEGLARHYAPTVNSVLRAADQYIAETNRMFQSQLDQMGAVPDSQRGALMSNLQAIVGSNVGKFINEVEQANTAQRVNADNFNAQAWAQTEDKNILERQKYQQGMLQGLAVNEENWNRYFDDINQEIQQKWNVSTTMNTLRSMFPDMVMGPNGELIYRPTRPVVTPKATYEAYADKEKKK